MRILSLSTGVFLLGSLLAPVVLAQDANQADLRQPSAVRQTAFQYDHYVNLDQDQGNAPPSSAAKAPAAAPAEEKKEEKKDEEKKDEAEAPKDEGWKLPQPCILKQHGWTVGGWLDVGMTFNGAYPSDGYNTPVGFNDLNQQPQVNQIYLSVNKAVDTKGCGIDYGGSFDLMYGSDARFTQANGLETPGNPAVFPPSVPGDTNFAYAYSPYRFSIPQAYLDLGINNLTIRTGHFVTNLGDETIDPRQNFFYSHSYTFLYGIPFTHTGMTFTYKCNDQLTVMGGVQTGENQFDYSPPSNYPGANVPSAPLPGQYEHLGYLGGITYTGPCKKLNVNFQISISDDLDNSTGFNGGAASGLCDPVVDLTLIAKYNLSDKLVYTAEETYGQQSDAVDGTATWYGFNQYLQYTINDKWAAGLRGEWFHDGSGVRVANLEPFSANNLASPAFSPVGLPGNFYEITAGLNWKPNANLTVRPEIRYDWSDATATIPVVAAPSIVVKPYNGGTTADQFLFAVDAILTF
jgi:hypothetical protein